MEDIFQSAALFDPALIEELGRKLASICASVDGGGQSLDDVTITVLAQYAGVAASLPEYAQRIQVVETRAQQTSKIIFDSRERLQIIWAKQNETVQRQWLKRSLEKRKKILLEAWPEMPLPHHPDFRALRRGLMGPSNKYCYLLPYVNQEDLSGPTNLLSLLEARSQHHPSPSVRSDMSIIETAAAAKAIELPSTFGYTMLLDEAAVEEYGKVLAWTEDPKTRAAVSDGRSYPPGVGLIILETQEKLLSVLVRCVELLLPDMDLTLNVLQLAEANVTSPALPQTDETGPGSIEWRSLKEMNPKAAYELPRNFDLDHLLRLATAKRDEAQDSIWALREDPSYFREVLEEEWVLFREITHKAHVAAGQRLPDDISQRYLGSSCRTVIREFYTRFIMWNFVLTELENLYLLRSAVDAEQLRGQSWELIYKEALELFTLGFWKIFHIALVQLRTIAAMSKPLQKYWMFTLKGNTTGSILKKSDREKWPPVLVLMDELFDTSKRYQMGAPKTLDELERTMRTEASQTALITPTVASRLSDVAAFGEIENSLRRHQPLIHPGRQTKPRGDIEEWTDNLAECVALVSDLGDYAVPLAQFSYPSHRRPLRQNIESMRTAEAKLDTLWAHVDDEFRQNTKGDSTLHELLGSMITPRTLHRTPPWKEPELPEPHDAMIPTANDEYHKPWSFPTEDAAPAQPEHTPKAKKKTTGIADPTREATVSEPPSLSQPTIPHRRIFTLHKRAYKTTTALFPSTLSEHTVGKVTWRDFIHMMYRLDFSIRKHDGSEWYFEPAWKPETPITIHEPHGGSDEIPLNRLRCHARRLKDRYQWTMESFVLA